jgi:NADPH:quinone reductase-like Zn-dependent oxidoreductase
VRGVREQVWPLVEEGKIRPIVDRRMPLAEAGEALRVLESSTHIGKLLLVT